jgi:hypothetical protein
MKTGGGSERGPKRRTSFSGSSELCLILERFELLRRTDPVTRSCPGLTEKAIWKKVIYAVFHLHHPVNICAARWTSWNNGA